MEDRIWWTWLTHKRNPATGLYDRRWWVKTKIGRALMRLWLGVGR